jgi:hypothetical protein
MMEDVKDKSLKDREYLPRRLHKKRLCEGQVQAFTHPVNLLQCRITQTRSLSDFCGGRLTRSEGWGE